MYVIQLYINRLLDRLKILISIKYISILIFDMIVDAELVKFQGDSKFAEV